VVRIDRRACFAAVLGLGALNLVVNDLVLGALVSDYVLEQLHLSLFPAGSSAANPAVRG